MTNELRSATTAAFGAAKESKERRAEGIELRRGVTLAAEARDKVLRYFRACVEKPAVSIVVGRLYHEWDRPGYGERLLLPLLDDNGLPQGLVGIPICKQTFPNRPVAELRAKRITSILPLGGAPATEEPG